MKLSLKILSFLIVLILSIVLIQKLVPFITSNTQLKVLVGETLFACAAFFWFIVFLKFWEELAFRGFILKKLITGIGPHKACLLVALIFGFLHLLSPIKSVNIVISTIFSGLLLNYAFLYSENLYFPIGIHFAWNFFLGKIFYSKYLFEVEYLNKIWAGYNNPEEGIIAIAITAAGFFIIMLCRKKLKFMATKRCGPET